MNKKLINFNFNSSIFNTDRSFYTLSFFCNSHYQAKFKSDSPSNPHRSQAGIWHNKRQMFGMKKCFSMKHTRRTFKVNTTNAKLKSQTLNKTFYLTVSTKALKTIKLFGGLDNYLLKSKHKTIEDSQYALYIKKLLQNKKLLALSPQSLSLNLKMLSLPFTSKRSQIKQTKKTRFNRLPSVFIPAHMKRYDLTRFTKDPMQLVSRIEREEIDNINKELDITTSNEKRLQLRDRLKVLMKEDHPDVIEQFKSIMPTRHADIRNEFMRIRGNYRAKIKYIDALKDSENVAKQFMKEEYKHYSEDYPEVQLILQQTEQQRKTKEAKSSVSNKKFTRELGDSEDTKVIEFDPYSGKLGPKYDKQIIRTRGNLKIKADNKKKNTEKKFRKFKTLRKLNNNTYVSKRDKKLLKKMKRETVAAKVSRI